MGETCKFSSKWQFCLLSRQLYVYLWGAPMDAGSTIGQTSMLTTQIKLSASMRLPLLLLFTLLLGSSIWPAVHAQESSSPYSVTVPVADTTEAQRNQAFAMALSQVMTRVAGGQDLRGKSGYNDALQNATSLVQKFQYQKAATGLVLSVDFAPASVRRQIKQLGVTSAGIKPPVLLLVQNSEGQLMDQSALGGLATAAAARGTNVVYPEAGAQPDLASIAAVDPAAMATLNQRYNTGLVLLGKLAGGTAKWTLISGGQAQQWSSQSLDEDSLLTAAGDGMVDRLGQQLNVIGSTPTQGKLWVSGLDSAEDYASLLATLNADPAVQQVTTVSARNDGVLLDIKANLPMSGLAANLAAGGRMLLQGEPHDGADANLRWLH